MVETISSELATYYQTVQSKGHLLTPALARRWSTAVLKTLGLNLDRRTRRRLARALPPELADALTRVFWLAHFRNTNLSAREFQSMAARRSGQTDADFALYPILAVFHALKQLIDTHTSDQVANSLSPELRKLWQDA